MDASETGREKSSARACVFVDAASIQPTRAQTTITITSAATPQLHESAIGHAAPRTSVTASVMPAASSAAALRFPARPLRLLGSTPGTVSHAPPFAR